MENRIEVVRVELSGGTTMYVESTILPGEEDVAFELLPFEEVTTAIENIAKAVIEPLKKIKPRKASVEFGLEIAVESGKLTTLLVKGSGTANLKITLEWSEKSVT